MSTVITTNGNPQTQLAPQKPIVHDESAISHLMDTARFEHLFRIANTLANSALTPKHLKGANKEETAANCFRVVNQAVRWKFDPFAVADETYVVSGKLGYQGKLVAAVVHARSGLRGRLRATYVGKGDDLTVTVTGCFADEMDERSITLSVRQARTSNKMWTEDPEQKLWYSGVTKWARRHCPEVLLGVLTEDDVDRATERIVEAVDVTPRGGNERLAAMLAPAPADDGGPTDDDIAGNIDHAETESNDDPLDGLRADLAETKTPAGVGGIRDFWFGKLPEMEKEIRELCEARKREMSQK